MKETFFQHDSLTGQTLRIVKQVRPGRIDAYVSDAKNDGRKHDHCFINLRTGEGGVRNRGQQR